MSKFRSVQTSMWTKSERFRQCDAIEKLLFLFLLTNPETSLCGAYEMLLDDIAHLTGIDARNLPHVFEGLERKGLAMHHDGWIIIPNYKAVYDNPKVQRGIEREMQELPEHIKDSLSKTTRNSNSNSNSNLREEEAPGVKAQREIRAVDEVVIAYRKAIEPHLPATSWPDTSKQYLALKQLADMARATAPQTPIGDPCDFAVAVVAAFAHLKSSATSGYWKNAAYDPVTILRRHADCVTYLSDAHGAVAQDRHAVQVMSEMDRIRKEVRGATH